jgi:hypothetical protein
MPITSVTWLMILALIGTDLLINLLVKMGRKEQIGTLKNDRRYFSHANHIPKSRSGADRRLNQH